MKKKNILVNIKEKILCWGFSLHVFFFFFFFFCGGEEASELTDGRMVKNSFFSEMFNFDVFFSMLWVFIAAKIWYF